MPKPLKRHISLQPLSREHHYGLLLSFKIREGLKLGVDLNRIQQYVEWHWEKNHKPHFEFEEEYVFPLLGKENKMVQQALAEHQDLERLFTAGNLSESQFSELEKAIVAHIRFEERKVFPEIEKVATNEQLQQMEQQHSQHIADDWEDEFWVKPK